MGEQRERGVLWKYRSGAVLLFTQTAKIKRNNNQEAHRACWSMMSLYSYRSLARRLGQPFPLCSILSGAMWACKHVIFSAKVNTSPWSITKKRKKKKNKLCCLSTVGCEYMSDFATGGLSVTGFLLRICTSRNGVWRTPPSIDNAILGPPSPKGPPVLHKPAPLCTLQAGGIVTCHHGCPDTVADLCVREGKQQWHRDTPGADKPSSRLGIRHKPQQSIGFTVAEETSFFFFLNKFLLQQIKINYVTGRSEPSAPC